MHIFVPGSSNIVGSPANVQRLLEERNADAEKPLFWVPKDHKRIIVPGEGEDKLRNNHPGYKPWAVGLKIQLTPSGMSWDQEVWFLRAADDNVVALAHTLWRRQAILAWRKAGNTGDLPIYPDTVGRTACVLLDEGDWFEYYKAARVLRAKDDKLDMVELGQQIMDVGVAPMFWCLRGHCFDFKHIFEDDADQDRLLIPE